ncbi:MAG: TetR/AcrR family transcriptional regulator [Treponema sp.]|nr:TetR/AcrR family transcriptional regulator [Treponema sp.]
MSCDTKEKIISSAFSFYNWINLEKISLSMIAERVGITKAAIYKHFKSKDELDFTMRDRIYSDFYEIIKDESHYGDHSAIIKEIIKMMINKKQYIFYLVSNTFNFNFDDFVLNLQKKGTYVLEDLFSKDGKVLNWNLYKNVIFIGGCLLFYLCALNMTCIKKNITLTEKEIDEFAEKLTAFVNKGTNGNHKDIGVFRLAELDNICRKNIEKIPESDRTLKAIAKIVSKSGFQGITVDSIAKELGLAKSSLYSKFSDKSQMISEIQHKMVSTMLELSRKNMENAENPLEGIYIFMETEAEFFMRYREVLTVCKWFQFQNQINKSVMTIEDEQKKYRRDYSYFLNCDIVKNIPDLGIAAIDATTVLAWYFAVTVFLCIHADIHNFSSEMIHAALKDIFYMIAEGQREEE